MPIDRALDRWKALWDLFHARSQKLGTTPPGFMAHSLEFWWLAKMQVKQPHLFDMMDETNRDSVDVFHKRCASLRSQCLAQDHSSKVS